jgi:hypothetical protein
MQKKKSVFREAAGAASGSLLEQNERLLGRAKVDFTYARTGGLGESQKFWVTGSGSKRQDKMRKGPNEETRFCSEDQNTIINLVQFGELDSL